MVNITDEKKKGMRRQLNLSEELTARKIIFDITGCILYSISVVNFAVYARFAPGGISGLAVILNYLFGLPIGLITIGINISVIIFTFRKLGLRFFIRSAVTTLVCAAFMDHIMVLFPDFTGSRLAASVLSAFTGGIGLSLIYNSNSSTGGTDFIIMAIKRTKPEFSFGFLAFVIDGSIILSSVFVYRDIMSFVYGLVYVVLLSVFMDVTTKFTELLGS